VTAVHKSYCYNVSYSPYSGNGPLMMNSAWSRRACCNREKSGQVSTKFLPIQLASEDVAVNTSTPFSMQCYTDESFQGTPLAMPAQVTVGQHVYCRITADTWDEKMFLVVPECRFANTPDEDQDVYKFVVDK
jgi:hypothetical protein